MSESKNIEPQNLLSDISTMILNSGIQLNSGSDGIAKTLRESGGFANTSSSSDDIMTNSDLIEDVASLSIVEDNTDNLFYYESPYTKLTLDLINSKLIWNSFTYSFQWIGVNSFFFYKIENTKQTIFYCILEQEMSNLYFIEPNNYNGPVKFNLIKTQSMIINNPIHDIHFFTQLGECSNSVGLIKKGNIRATGFLVAKNIIMTNHHVTNKNSRTERICFNYYKREKTHVYYKVIRYLRTNLALDYTLCEIEDCPIQPLKCNDREIKYNKKKIIIIQHPDGDYKKFSYEGFCFPDNDINKITHYCSTMPGSSGSPIFDVKFQVIGLHNAGVGNDHNKGLKMEKIVKDVRNDEKIGNLVFPIRKRSSNK